MWCIKLWTSSITDQMFELEADMILLSILKIAQGRLGINHLRIISNAIVMPLSHQTQQLLVWEWFCAKWKEILWPAAHFAYLGRLPSKNLKHYASLNLFNGPALSTCIELFLRLMLKLCQTQSLLTKKLISDPSFPLTLSTNV